MATVTICDRCGASNTQLTPVLGKELCNGCVRDLMVWVDMGVPVMRSCRGDWGRAIEVLLRRHEQITISMLEDVTSKPRKQCHWALRDAVRRKTLRSVRSGVWARYEAEAAE